MAVVKVPGDCAGRICFFGTEDFIPTVGERSIETETNYLSEVLAGYSFRVGASRV